MLPHDIWPFGPDEASQTVDPQHWWQHDAKYHIKMLLIKFPHTHTHTSNQFSSGRFIMDKRLKRDRSRRTASDKAGGRTSTMARNEPPSGPTTLGPGWYKTNPRYAPPLKEKQQKPYLCALRSHTATFSRCLQTVPHDGFGCHVMPRGSVLSCDSRCALPVHLPSPSERPAKCTRNSFATVLS